MQNIFYFVKNGCKPTFNRFIFTTFKCHYEDLKVIKPYLLDRSRPASEILDSLEKDDLEELNRITNEYKYLLASNGCVPNNLTDENCLDMLSLKESQRLRYLKRLLKNELSLQKKQSIPTSTVSENENASSIITNRFISKYKNYDLMCSNRLCHSIILNSQEIVIDLSFENLMNLNTLNSLASNLVAVYSHNRSLREPLQLIFTRFQPGTITYSAVNKIFSFPFKNAQKIEDLLLVLSGKHYLDLFPNRRFVYLSPNSKNFFQPGEYDHNAVYIIGGLVEKARVVPVTLGRARAENIEHRAFPIDRYFKWKIGSKSLDIITSFKILASAQQSDGDWKAALEKHIPMKHYTDTPKKNLAMKILTI